jgi:hypothetical protein
LCEKEIIERWVTDFSFVVLACMSIYRKRGSEWGFKRKRGRGVREGVNG